jgi:hypothetical protein
MEHEEQIKCGNKAGVNDLLNGEPCSPVEIHQRFEQIYYFFQQYLDSQISNHPAGLCLGLASPIDPPPPNFRLSSYID